MSTETPTFTIKKRKAPKASTSKLSFGGANGEGGDESINPTSGAAPEDEGSAVVIRNRGKKTPAGRIKDREGTGKTRLSFGASSTSSANDGMDMDESGGGAPTFVKRSQSSTSASTTTPRRGLLRDPSTSSLVIPAPPRTSSSDSNAANGDSGRPTVTSSSSIYSKEYLDQLKKDQASTPKFAPIESTRTGADEGYDELTTSKFGTARESAPTNIPTTNAIAQAKARREEMRKAGVPDDYISLSGGGGGAANAGTVVGFANKSGDSRLVREEDELGDGDDDLAQYTGALDQVPLGRKANREAAIKLRGEMGDMIDEVEGDVSDEDEEMRRWEEAQIRRGGERELRASMSTNLGAAGNKVYRPTPIPQSATLPSLSAVTARLSLELSTLQSSHVLDQASLDHFTHERQELDKQEQELRLEVAKTEKKNRWFDEFKETVEDWAAFLDEKFPQLEKIEKDYLDIQRERYDIISKRRFADDSDDVSLFTGSAIPAERTRLTKRRGDGHDDDDDDATMNDGLAAGAAHRDLDPRSIARSTRRAERQTRYENEVAARAGPSSSSTTTTVYPDPIVDPGYESDSSLSPTDTEDLAQALASLRTSLAGLFSDVKVDDFRDPNLGIRAKFEEWRTLWREEYSMLFGALGLVGVWEFWARVEMSSWNPFEIEQLPQTCSDLSQYSWHQALSSYGHRETDAELERGDDDALDGEEPMDESTEVINALVTSVVIPRLSSIARASYDPLSSRQTVAAVRLVDEISYCVERDSPKFETLVQSFLFRLRSAIHTSQLLLVPHLERLSTPAIAYDPSTFVARQHFLSRQVKLLRTCMRWRRMMKSLRVPVTLANEDGDRDGDGDGDGLPAGGEGFDELVVRELVARVMLPVIEASWSTGGEAVAQRVLDALPKDSKVVSEALKRRLNGQA